PGRFRVQFTAGSELHGKIVRAQALLRREIPDGDLAAVFDRALTLLVREVERVRFAVPASPRKDAADADPTPSSRRVPDPIRRAVWIRDGGQCTFRDGRGHRCSARERLEPHHVTPFGRGGDHGADNLRLVCAAHNAHQASLDYGARFMDDRRVSRSGPRLSDQMSGASSSRPQPV
ncbi:MAG TPA: HNH endonuclease signature motif containing protein, partial [Kofleriaceae bacterium]|nr:HNH endonuclease signature motif containing protein [Kofleriaceae bacterium]